MKPILTVVFFYVALTVSGQSKSDSCNFTVKGVKYPEEALKHRISGTVMVELDVNEDGTLANPVVVKGLGYGCDEAALAYVKKIIERRNPCFLRWNLKVEKGKTKQPVVFLMPEE